MSFPQGKSRVSSLHFEGKTSRGKLSGDAELASTEKQSAWEGSSLLNCGCSTFKHAKVPCSMDT